MDEAPLKLDAGSVKRCHFPPPSAALFEKMARAGLAANSASGILFKGSEQKVVEVAWEAAEEHLREAMLIEAQAMYGVLAVEAGARPTGIDQHPADGPGKAKPMNGPMKGGLDPCQ